MVAEKTFDAGDLVYQEAPLIMWNVEEPKHFKMLHNFCPRHVHDKIYQIDSKERYIKKAKQPGQLGKLLTLQDATKTQLLNLVEFWMNIKSFESRMYSREGNVREKAM